MIWLSYRQARLQLVVGLMVLALVALALALTGPALADLARSADFLTLATQRRVDSFLYVATTILLLAVPALLGAFWGAPLVAREVENGSHRLAWTQSVTRTRWLAGRLALGAAGAAVGSGLLSLAVGWWAAPIDTAVAGGDRAGVFNLSRMSPALFGVRGVVPIGYALLAFTIGVVAGLLLRHTVTAIGVTLALVVAVQAFVPMFVRAHLAAPVTDRVVISPDNLTGLIGEGQPGQGVRLLSFDVKGADPGDWTLDNHTVTAAGSTPENLPGWMENCLPAPGQNLGGTADTRVLACLDRVEAEGYRQELAYHPADAFWTLQWHETGLLLTGAALLTGFAFWRIRRDL